jgi:hypothetical protein
MLLILKIQRKFLFNKEILNKYLFTLESFRLLKITKIHRIFLFIIEIHEKFLFILEKDIKLADYSRNSKKILV